MIPVPAAQLRRSISILKKAALVFLFCTTAVMLPAQTFTDLANFIPGEGGPYYMALVQGPDGNFYGTTAYGGAKRLRVYFLI